MAILFLRDIAQLSIIAIVAAVAGFGINALRPAPLAMRYEPPAVRLARTPPNAQASPVTLLTLGEMRTLVTESDVLVLDARADLFYQIGHIAGAANLPKEGFAEAFALLEPHLRSGRFRLLAIYCSGGDCEDSAYVASQLMQRGIGPLAIFEGGWEQWELEFRL